MIYQIIFFGSPLILAAILHGLCIKYAWFYRLKKPLDFGINFRGKRIFGDNKTWRGLLINVVFCTVGTLIQASLQRKGYLPQWLLLLDYKNLGYFVGILLGLGMTFGELPNSFLKRQLNIAQGKRSKGLLGVILFLFDQVDLAIGIWVLFFFIIRPCLSLILMSLLITIVMHMTVSIIGFLLGMRETIL